MMITADNQNTALYNGGNHDVDSISINHFTNARPSEQRFGQNRPRPKQNARPVQTITVMTGIKALRSAWIRMTRQGGNAFRPSRSKCSLRLATSQHLRNASYERITANRESCRGDFTGYNKMWNGDVNAPASSDNKWVNSALKPVIFLQSLRYVDSAGDGRPNPELTRKHEH